MDNLEFIKESVTTVKKKVKSKEDIIREFIRKMKKNGINTNDIREIEESEKEKLVKLKKETLKRIQEELELLQGGE